MRDKGSSQLSGGAAALALAWVGLYTRWVDGAEAERRRAEVRSDLWEQQALARVTGESPLTTGLSILRRVVGGMRSDLSWASTSGARMRRGRDGHVPAVRTWTTTCWMAGGVGIAAAYVYFTVVLWLEPGRPFVDQTIVLLPSVVLIASGLVWRSRRRRLADGLVALGSLFAAGLIWIWPLALTAMLVIAGALGDIARSEAPSGVAT